MKITIIAYHDEEGWQFPFEFTLETDDGTKYVGYNLDLISVFKRQLTEQQIITEYKMKKCA